MTTHSRYEPYCDVPRKRLREIARALSDDNPRNEIFLGSGGDFTIVTADEMREIVRMAGLYLDDWSRD